MKFLLLAMLALVGLAAADKTIVQTAQETPALSTLVKVLTSPGYEPVLNALNSPGNFTVFAPNNDAFAKAKIDPSMVDLVTQVLYYHVLGVEVHSHQLSEINFPDSLMKDPKYVDLNGEAQRLNVFKDHRGDVFIFWGVPFAPGFTAKVQLADVQCSNGVVHIIDHVIFFPDDVGAFAKHDLLGNLGKALAETNLTTAVATTPFLTIFAPIDIAFDRVHWKDLPASDLAQVLTYHVVPGKPLGYTTNLRKDQQLKTLNGQTVTVEEYAGRIFLKDSKGGYASVLFENILLKNGVAHIIDRVLLPNLKDE